MKNLKLWKYDIRNGFFCNKDKLLLIIPAVLICRMQKFIPEWMLVNLCILYGTLNYTFSEFHTMGIQFLPRMGSRRMWWLSKCIWQVSFVFAAHFTVYLTAWILYLWMPQEEPYFFASRLLKNILVSEEQKNSGKWDVTLMMVLLAVAVSLLLNMIQMLLTLLMGLRYAFLTTLTVLVAIEIFDVGWLGNDMLQGFFSMLQTYGMGESREMIFLVLLCGLCVITALTGSVVFHRYDLTDLQNG